MSSQSVEIKVVYSVPAPIIYKTLTDQIQICQFTRTLAVSEPRPEGKLEMFDGSIQGIYQELTEDTQIKMKWKFKHWAEYADVVIDFVSFNDSCEIKVSYTNIPDRDEYGNNIHTESITQGWRENIFKMIHMVFGYPLRDEWD